MAALIAIVTGAGLAVAQPALAAPACQFAVDRPSCGPGLVTSFDISPTQSRVGPGAAVTYRAVTNLGDVTAGTTFTITDGTCNGNVCFATDLGDHTVTASASLVGTRTATLSVDRLAISPGYTSVPAGHSVRYGVSEIRGDGSVYADLSSVATVTMNGVVCPGNVCTPTKAGQATINATYGSIFGGGAVMVTAGPATRIALSPANSSVYAGTLQYYAASTVDAYGNPIADVTGLTALAISPDGICITGLCVPSTGGAHTVTAAYAGLTGTASLYSLTQPTLFAGPLPAATAGHAYSQPLVTSGNPAPVVSLHTGTLPAGLTLSSAGILSGTPTSAGDYAFDLRAVSVSGTAEQAYTMHISPAPAVLPRISLKAASTVEGNSGQHTVNMTISLSAASKTPVTVAWRDTNGTALAGSDYVLASGVVTFAPGATTGSIPVTVRGDTVRESDEVLYVLLSNPTGATLATGSGAFTITNDD
jgi:hypothetical protein